MPKGFNNEAGENKATKKEEATQIATTIKNACHRRLHEKPGRPHVAALHFKKKK